MAITNTLKARLMIAAKTASAWATYPQVPLLGELCFETDTLKLKVGNGTDPFTDLEYINSFPSIWLDAVKKFNTSPTGTNDANGGPKIIFKAGNDFNASGTDTTHKYIDIDINADHTITVKTKGIDAAINTAVTNLNTDITTALQELEKKIPSVKGGNKITETVNTTTTGTTVTLNHDTTTVDTTPTATLTHGDTFSAYTASDDYGHVTKKTTFTLPTINNGTVAAGASKVVTGVTTTAGVVTGVDSVAYKDIIQGTVEDGNHTTVSTTTAGIKIDHNAVGTTTVKTPTTDGEAGWTASVISSVFTDSYGHVGKVVSKTLPANPVSAATASSGQLMKSDGDNTTSPSGFTASNGTITTTGANNATTLPTVKAIVDYIGNITSTAMHYQGAVTSYNTLPTTGQAVGDVYVLSADDATGPYEKGDYFIWNGTSWDVITGENQVENKAAVITDSLTDIATVDGVKITAKVPTGTTAAKGIVQLTNTYTSTDATKAATGKSIKAALDTLDMSDDTVKIGASTLSIWNVTQTNGKLALGDKIDVIFGSGLSILPAAGSSNTQTLSLDFVDDLHNTADQRKTASAKQIWDEFAKRNVAFVETGDIEIDDADLA